MLCSLSTVPWGYDKRNIKTDQSSLPSDDFKRTPTVHVEIAWCGHTVAGGISVVQPMNAATRELFNYKKFFSEQSQMPLAMSSVGWRKRRIYSAHNWHFFRYTKNIYFASIFRIIYEFFKCISLMWYVCVGARFQCLLIWQCQMLLNPLNAELNPIRHLLALVGDRHIVHVSRLRVNVLMSFVRRAWVS